MKTKIAALLLAVLMLATALAACGGDKTPADTTTPSPETTTEAPDTTTEAPETTVPAPETTTEAPETTTEAPETTTPEPETTVPPVPAVNSPSELITKGKNYELKLTLVGTYSVGGDFKNGQGMCTDGKYAYLVFENKSSKPQTHKIAKVDLATYEVVKVSEALPLDHGNDLTYNPNTGEILVAHNNPSPTLVSRINPETLTIIETFDIGQKIYGITYCPWNDTYCLGISGGYQFSIVNEHYVEVNRWSGKSGYTKQGLDGDEKYMYFSKYDTNCVEVYEWDGDFVTRMSIAEQSMELEAIFHIGGTIYLNFIKPSQGEVLLYSAQIVEK